MQQRSVPLITFPSDKVRLVRRAIALSWFTIVYNLIEGVVSIAFGVENDAIALAGFGGDSLIEVASAFVVLWRFRGEEGQGDQLSLKRERAATITIGALFVLLAAVTVAAAGLQLKVGSHPATTLPGVIIAALSLSFMFYLWAAKKKVARSLNSATVMKDADCSLACIKLSVILFVGSMLHVLTPQLWWSDAVAAIFIAVLIGKEGWDTIRAARSANFAGGCGCAHTC